MSRWSWARPSGWCRRWNRSASPCSASSGIDCASRPSPFRSRGRCRSFSAPTTSSRPSESPRSVAGVRAGAFSGTRMTDQVEYVYAVVDADAALGAPPAGVEEARVRLETEGELGALVSSLDADAYAPPTVESRTADLDWLGPRAKAHDVVISWASERGAVIPLPMFSLFRDP